MLRRGHEDCVAIDWMKPNQANGVKQTSQKNVPRRKTGARRRRRNKRRRNRRRRWKPAKDVGKDTARRNFKCEFIVQSAHAVYSVESMGLIIRHESVTVKDSLESPSIRYATSKTK